MMKREVFRRIKLIFPALALAFLVAACGESTAVTESGTSSASTSESSTDVSSSSETGEVSEISPAPEPDEQSGSDAEKEYDITVPDGAVYVSTYDELKDALANASKDEEDPTVICLTADIEQTATKVDDILTVASGTYVTIMSQDGKSSIIQTEIQTASGTAVIIVNGTLTLQYVTIDINDCGRGIYVEREAMLTLNEGSTVKRGTITSKNVNAGLGIYVAGPLANGETYGTLIINDGALITENTQKVATYGRALGLGVYAGGHVVMNGGTISNNSDTVEAVSTESRSAGAGVYCKSSVSSATTPWVVNGITNFTMNGGTICDNTGFIAGGIYCGDYTTVELNGGSITGNTVEYAGGGIATDGSTGNTEYLAKLTVTIADGFEISGNTAFVGGGIYAGNGIMDIGAAYITNNTAFTAEDEYQYQSSLCSFTSAGGSGGGIYNVQTALTLTGTQITGNSAISLVADGTFALANGGGIYVTCGSTYTYESSLTVYEGTVITGNSVSGTGEYTSKGGGICVGFMPVSYTADRGEGTFVPTVNIYGGTITGNTAGEGDDLYVCTLIPYSTKISGGTVLSETDYREGSPFVNIFEAASVGVTYPEDLTPFESEAEENGEESGEGSSPSATVTPEPEDGDESENVNKTSEADRQALLENSAYTTASVPSSAVRVKDGDEFTAAVSSGSAFIVFTNDIVVTKPVEIDTDMVIFGNGYSLTLDSDTFHDALLYIKSGTVKLDALYIYSGTDARPLYIEKGCNCYLNAAVLSGRRLADEGLSIYNAGTLTISYTTITNASSATTNYRGLIFNKGVLTMKVGTYVDPEAYVYTGTVYNTGTFNMEGGTFGGTGSNSNRGRYGAGVTNYGTFNMSGGTITGCGHSEAVYTNGTFVMTGGKITENNTTCTSGITYNSVYSGGGVLVYGGTFEMYDGAEISNNTGYMGAGVGIYYTGTVFNMYGGVISGNLATIYPGEEKFNENNSCGGGVAITGGAIFNMYGGEISGNTAYIGDEAEEESMGAGKGKFYQTGKGGGIYVLKGTVNIEGGTITGNTSCVALYTEDGGLGGGIYINDDSTGNAIVNITGGTISGNKAEGGNGYGSDIYSDSSKDPTRDIICLYIGGDAKIGSIYLGTNMTVLGIGTTINKLTVDSLVSNGRESIGSTIAVYSDGAVPGDDDVDRLNFEGVSDLTLDSDGDELVIDMLNLANVTEVKIEDAVFTGKEISSSTLNATLVIKDEWELSLPGLSGLRVTEIHDNIDVGTGYLSVRGDGIRYTGTIENIPFTISPMSLDSEGISVEFADPDAIYISDGETAFEPEINLILDAQSSDEETAYLKQGSDGDYTVYYSNNINSGTAYVVVKATGNTGSNYTGSAFIPFEIYEKESLESIELDLESLTLYAGTDPETSEYQLKASLIPEGAAETPVVWKTDDESVATVDQNGVVTAVGQGSTVLTVAAQGDPNIYKKIDVNILFSDVSGSNSAADDNYQYYYDAVYWAVGNGIMTGLPSEDGSSDVMVSFGVGEEITKGEFLVMLWKYAGSPESSKYKDPSTVFADMVGADPESDIYKAAAWGYSEKVVIGSEQTDGLYLYPDVWLSRGDLTVMLWRAAGKPRKYGKLNYTDITEAGYKKSSDMYKAVLWITKTNIAKGYVQDDGTYIYGLTVGCYREYAATYLYKYMKLTEDDED